MADPIPSRIARIDLWIVPIPGPHAGSPFPPDTLSSEELARASRFRKPDDSLQFICTRHALRTILGRRLGVRGQDVRFVVGPQGKPALAEGPSPVEFSVSHATGLALVGLCDTCPIGVDIEPLPDAHERLEAIRAVLSEEETQAPPPDPAIAARYMLTTWVLKEAILKADSRGLSAAPQEITVLTRLGDILANGGGTCRAFSTEWQLRVFDPRPGYVGAVAADADEIDLHVREWD